MAVAGDNDELNSITPDILIANIRQKELEQFMLKSSAIFRSPTNTIFRLPSNEYSHVFVRVGNIQMSRTVLDAIFFWTIPYLKNAGSILTDSWTISSIALNISRLLCRYDSSIRIEDFHVNMLASHYDGKKKLDRQTEDNLHSLAHGNTKEILFLISAVKTLKSLENVKKVFAVLEMKNRLQYLALYKLIDEPETNFLCDLSRDFSIENSIKFDSYTSPPKNEEVVEIDDKVFFPIRILESQVLIGHYCTKANEAFFRNYEGKSVLSLHRDSYYFGKDLFRHHGIYLDVSKMLQCAVFREKLRSEINNFDKAPALIIYPPHEHGRDLVEAIQADLKQKFDLEIEAHSVLDIDFLSRKISDPLIQKLSCLGEKDLILVVDDVSTTGSRLKNYQKKLRHAYIGQIHYFIGVARPRKLADWNLRLRDLKYRPGKLKHIVSNIEQVFLPDWDSKTCPWCIEKEIIDKIVSKPEYAKYPLTRKLKNRYFKLQKAVDKGLHNDVFFCVNLAEKPKFKGDSVFSPNKDVSESDLVASVAAAIQQVRNEGGMISPIANSLLIPFKLEYPHFKIINLHDYMGKDCSYNEALVRAALIRSAERNELRAKTEENRRVQVKEMENFFSYSSIENQEVGFFIYELFLAVRENKLPRPENGLKMLKMLEDAYNFEFEEA